MMKLRLLLLSALLLPLSAHAGSQTYASPGAYVFTVPATYGNLIVQVWGGGGGGAYLYAGGNGGASAFGSVVAGGGYGSNSASGAPGGSAHGGDINISGGSGVSNGASGGGGASPYGGAGGAGLGLGMASPGSAPGGGGGGSAYWSWGGGVPRGGAGAGAYAKKTYPAGALSGTVSVTVGGGGAGGGSTDPSYHGGAGAPGRVTITWSDAPATCSVTLTPNPINQGGSSTLSWSASNADTSVYINNVGYVSGSSGSFSVAPSATTDYSCYAAGSGGSDGWHAAVLTVRQSCVFNGSAVANGTSVTAYESDAVPYGESCVSENRTCSDGTLSGSYAYASCEVSRQSCTLDGVTVPHGDSRTFYTSQTTTAGQLCSAIAQERTCTDGDLSGSPAYQYASCSCAASYSCSGNTITYTDASCHTSTVLACTAPYLCVPGSSSCISPEPVFNASGDRSGHLQAVPILLRRGEVAALYWNVSNVQSCTVTGNNGDSWNGLSGEKTSSPIIQQTAYTLACAPLGEASFSPETVTINIVPIFQEL
jgi:hypothetical protein